MGAKPKTRLAIIAAIEEHGPMTVVEIAETIGKTRAAIQACIYETRKVAPGTLRIAGYRREDDQQGEYPAKWGLGPGPDAQPPRDGKIARRRRRQARYREKHRMEIRVRDRMRRKPENPRRNTMTNPFYQLMAGR